jgi:mannose-6-phosphate isomerase-like protein (cupin superfamily)
LIGREQNADPARGQRRGGWQGQGGQRRRGHGRGRAWRRRTGADLERRRGAVLSTERRAAEDAGLFPTLGGYRFVIFTVPPEGVAAEAAAKLGPEGLAKVQAEMDGHIGTGLQDWMEPDHPGMHTTDTIDFEVILSGEVWLELDDGEEVHLKEGDTFVQNGTRHRWFNRGTVPAKIAVVLIGGRPR